MIFHRRYGRRRRVDALSTHHTTHTRMHASTHGRTHVHTHARMHTHTNARTHIHTHMHARTHARTYANTLASKDVGNDKDCLWAGTFDFPTLATVICSLLPEYQCFCVHTYMRISGFCTDISVLFVRTDISGFVLHINVLRRHISVTVQTYD